MLIQVDQGLSESRRTLISEDIQSTLIMSHV